MNTRLRVLSSTALAAFLLAGLPVRAEDPPARVGRISYIEGTVSFHEASQNDWSYATLNYPVVSGNAFWTEPDGRSEVQIGSVEVRMDHSTEMDVMQLDNATTRLEVPQGVVNIHFSTPPLNGSVEVLTPVGPIELTQPGTYHIDAGQPTANTPSNTVQVTALEGKVSIRGPRSLLEVMPGETAVLNGNPPVFSLQEGNPTPFDDWALSRERREEAHASAQYISPHMTGYEDLDAYGQWAPDPSYGAVWYPTAVQADWAPYSYGHWAYIAPWGWTWVDNAPWGFAPFHYGRWSYIGHRWGWVPGEVVPAPVYAPALVAFVGGGGWNVSLALGGTVGAIGWVPLGPREVFHPYYPTSVNYARNVNIANVNRAQLNNITVNNYHNVSVTNYVNQRAAAVVPANAFQQGQPVHKLLLKVPAQQLAHAPVNPALSHVSPSSTAREEGRPLPVASQGQMPKAAIEDRVNQASKNASAPAETRVPAVAHSEQYSSHEFAAGHEEQNDKPLVYNHAPGPQIHHQSASSMQSLAYKNSDESLPKADVPHPQQQTHIAPTAKGWQRVPQQAQQPHEAPHPAPHPAAEQHPRNEGR